MIAVLSVLGLLLPLAPATSSEVQSVVAANNQFALDLYGQLGGAGGNLFFSPYSITKALALAYAGARGETASEMAAVLHFKLGPDRQHAAFLETRKLLNRAAGPLGGVNPWGGKRNVQLYLSANVWGQRGYGFKQNYLNLLRDYYGAGMEEVNFGAPEEARRTINAWVEKQTRDKIRDLFAPGAIDTFTRLVLTSAIYFKGDWVHEFPKGGTQNETFWLAGGARAEVPMMSQTETFAYAEDQDAQVLGMPYQGRDLAMTVFLPTKRDGLADLEKTLTAERLAAWVARLREQKVQVSFPKFKLTEAFSLNGTLSALGMGRAFGAGADFSGMYDGRETLMISTVVHQAFVDVNEEGTEAAAATGVVMSTLSSGVSTGPQIPIFRADHPFLFTIRDVRTGVILFIGRVAKP